ncbi:MAG: hypothetical protein HXY49_05465 [Ignavibacteriaceae bacterium]|nr:hypothetical protein [Ignavibacteriaceae bacterium]
MTSDKEPQLNLQPGDLILFSHTRLFDRLVRWFTKSEFSHAGIVYELGEKKIKVGEAWGSGFGIRTRYVSELPKCKIRRAKVELKDVKRIQRKYIGKPYDRLNIIGLVIHSLTGKKLFVRSVKKITCSEVSARFFYDASKKQIDFQKEFHKPYDYITPADLARSKQLRNIKLN